MSASTRGHGYAVSSLDAMGDGYGFRKVRRELEVTAFGINALVLPPEYETGRPLPRPPGGDVLRPPRARSRSASATAARIGSLPGGVARVDPGTHRSLRNVGGDDAVVLVAGGADGYVGRDGQAVQAPARGGPPGAR